MEAEILKDTLNALDRLLNLFRLERIIHLIVGVLAFLMLLYAIAVLLTRRKEMDTALLVSLFGSSGLIAVSSARITYFFNKAFNLVEHVIRELLLESGRTHGRH